MTSLIFNMNDDLFLTVFEMEILCMFHFYRIVLLPVLSYSRWIGGWAYICCDVIRSTYFSYCTIYCMYTVFVYSLYCTS